MRSSSSLKVISEIGRTRNSSSSSNDRKYKKTKVLNTREKQEIECYTAISELKRLNSKIININEIEIKDFLNERNIKFGNLVEKYNDTDDEINCIELNKDGKLEINKNGIIIDKYIGSGSYGIVFINDDRTARYAIKFIKQDKREIEIMKEISKKNSKLEEPIPNYIYTAHYYLNCNKIEIKDNKITSTLDKCLSLKSDGKYSMIIIEHLDGTINEILGDDIRPEEEKIKLYKSIFGQMIISLYLYHNKFNYYHNDAHLNNFFYKKVIKDDKYLYYKIGEDKYYIKNEGYLVILGDYGLASNITDDKKKRIMDYKHIISYIHSLCIYNEYYGSKRKIIENLMRLTNQRSIIPEEITELDVVKDLLKIFNNKKEERIEEEKQINIKAYN
jgi:hypothetical protein